jgi:hypothetical protein
MRLLALRTLSRARARGSAVVLIGTYRPSDADSNPEKRASESWFVM